MSAAEPGRALHAQDNPTDLAEFTGSTLLVTGGGGFLGQTVLHDLSQVFPGRLINVGRAPRHPNPLVLRAPHQNITTDLRAVESWIDLLASADYVIWLAALRSHTASIAEAFDHNVSPLKAAVAALAGSTRLKRFVYAGSISALDQPPYPARPRRITDEHAAHPRTPYGLSKHFAEETLAASGLLYTVLRLPFLYGPGFRAGSFLDFYRRVALRAPLSAVRYTANLSLLYTGDVANLLLSVLAAENTTEADASPYVVSDGELYEVDELISLVAEYSQRGRPRIRVPAGVGRAASTLAQHVGRIRSADLDQRSEAWLLATYWSHAAFTRDYFAVNSTRFHAAFPAVRYTPIRVGMANALDSG